MLCRRWRVVVCLMASMPCRWMHSGPMLTGPSVRAIRFSSSVLHAPLSPQAREHCPTLLSFS